MIQCEKQNLLRNYLIKNISRPDMQLAKTLNPDFICLGKILIIDVKQLVGVQALINQNQNISLGQSSYNLGRNLMLQRERFLHEKGGLQMNQILNVVDLGYVEPEYRNMAHDAVLQGVKDASRLPRFKNLNATDTEIVFINDNIDNKIINNIKNNDKEL